MIELLVVIGIISLLISIILPALHAARTAANSTACLSNLHNLGQAIAVYECNFHGVVQLGAATDQILYSQTQAEAFSNSSNYVAFNKLRLCPEMYQYQTAVNTLISFNSYGWNSWVTSYLQEDYTSSYGAPPVYLQRTRVANTAQVMLAGDVILTNSTGIELGASSDFYDPYHFSSSLTPGLPVFHGRHAGKGSILWMDLHASLESPTPVPLNAAVNVNQSTALQLPPAFYRANHIGYLCRAGDPLNTMSAEYYFLFRKDFIASNNMAVYHNIVYKSAW